MKRILVCGMLLGLLTAVSWAQRGRTMGGGGVTPGARMPSAGVGSPNVGMNPHAVGMPHGALPSAATSPNATTSKTPDTVKPNATFNPKANTVGSHTESGAPDHVTLPDAHSGPGPDR